jgi:hypothetical protein
LSKLDLPAFKMGSITVTNPGMSEALAGYGVSVGEVVKEVDWVVSNIRHCAMQMCLQQRV